MKKVRKKLISLAVAEVWTVLFKANENRPHVPDSGDSRRMIAAGIIQLRAEEEKKLWAIYDKFQSKNAALAAEKMEKLKLLRMNSNQPIERSALFSDVIFNWVSDVADLYERQADKMRKVVGKEKSTAFFYIELNYAIMGLESLMTGGASFQSSE